MSSIFVMTFNQLLKPKMVCLYLLISALVSIVIFFSANNLLESSILQGQITSFTSFFVKLIFIWILGLPYVTWILYYGTGLIAVEQNNGTLLLLLTKPLSRNKIFLGKLAALLMASLLIGVISIFLNLSLMIFITSPDTQIIFRLLYLVPALFMYLLFIAFFFSTLALGLSVLFESKKKVFWRLLVVELLLYIGLPLLKEGMYSTNFQLLVIHYLDFSQHLSTVFIYFLSFIKGSSLSPAALTRIFDWYSGIVTNLQIPMDLNRNGFIISINPLIILTSWLISSCLVLTLALRRFANMDITNAKD